MRRRILVVLIPLVALAADYALFPVFFDAIEKTADVTYLLAHQNQSIGTFFGHKVYASLDDIQSAHFLSQLNESGNALVISAFSTSDDESPPSSGPLLRAVEGRLQALSPTDHRLLIGALERKGGMAPGAVLSVRLSLPKDKYPEFPIDNLFILFFNSTPEAEDVAKGIKTILSLAQIEHVSNLIVPCAGTRWESKRTFEFGEFFDSVFTNLSSSDRPFAIYLSLYEQWPSFVLEDAVASLNSSWHATFRQPDKISTIYRRDYRLTLLFLSLCLLVCSFYTRLTVKNTLIISISFAAAGLGSKQLIDLLVEGHSPIAGFILKVAVLVVLALGFPFIVNWSPKDIFTTDEGK